MLETRWFIRNTAKCPKRLSPYRRRLHHYRRHETSLEVNALINGRRKASSITCALSCCRKLTKIIARSSVLQCDEGRTRIEVIASVRHWETSRPPNPHLLPSKGSLIERPSGRATERSSDRATERTRLLQSLSSKRPITRRRKMRGNAFNKNWKLKGLKNPSTLLKTSASWNNNEYASLEKSP